MANSDSIINNFSTKPFQDTIIKVIGVGGGGCNAVNNMYREGIEGVNFAVCNTDDKNLSSSPVPVKVALGPDVTYGLGSGDTPEVALKAAQASDEDLDQLFDDKTRMVFVCAYMGGGTGTGAGPYVAQKSREKNKLTVGVTTTPFSFEGDYKFEQAINGIYSFAKHCDALIVINNQNLFDFTPDAGLHNAFHLVDDTVRHSISAIARIVNDEGYINVDFADVVTTLRNGGVVVMNTGVAKGEGRVKKAIENALYSPLIKYNDFTKARRLLMNFYCSQKNAIQVSDTADINNFTKTMPGVKVKWGINFDDKLNDEVAVTIIATGPEMNFYPDKGLPASLQVHFLGQQDRPESLSAEQIRKIQKALYGATDQLDVPLLDFDRLSSDDDYFDKIYSEPALQRVFNN